MVQTCVPERRRRHHADRPARADLQPQPFIQADRGRVRGEDVKEGPLRAGVNAGGDRADEPRREALTAVIGRSAHAADFPPAVERQPLAGHRHEHAFPADPEVAPELDRPLKERTRLGHADQLEHPRQIVAVEQHRPGILDAAQVGVDHLDQLELADRCPVRGSLEPDAGGDLAASPGP